MSLLKKRDLEAKDLEAESLEEGDHLVPSLLIIFLEPKSLKRKMICSRAAVGRVRASWEGACGGAS